MPASTDGPVFLDANVFIYAMGADETRRAACANLLLKVARAEIAATTSAEVIQEVLHVVGRRRGGAAAASAAESALGICEEVLPVTADNMRRAAKLLRLHGGLSVRDAVQAAVMRGAGLHRIVSADRGFDDIAGLVRVDPFDSTAVASLAAV